MKLAYRLYTATIFCLTFICTACFPTLASADEAATLSGWTHIDSEGRSGRGALAEGKAVTFSSIATGEIDGDDSNGLEVAVGAPNGVLTVIKADGSVLWSRELPNASCSATGNSDKLFSSPAIGNLFGNGVPYVVVGYGGLGKCGGGVVAFHGPSGDRRWHFDLEQFAKKQGYSENLYGVFTSPALADTNGNGSLEIGFGAFDRAVYLLNAAGNPIWRYTAADTVWASPSFANVDDDANLEMIIGTDISKNTGLNPPTPNGGYLYALKTTSSNDGKSKSGKKKKKKRKKKKKKKRNRTRLRVRGVHSLAEAVTSAKYQQFGFRSSDRVVWYTAVDQILQSSPVVGDVIPGNGTLEVVTASGCYFPENTSDKTGKWVKVFNASNGKLLRTFDVPACTSSTPAIADVDGDGSLEIIATANSGKKAGGDGLSRVYVWKADTGETLWENVPLYNGNNEAAGGTYQSPVVADLDGNGSLEVVVANGAAVSIFAGATGTQLTCTDTPCGNALELSGGPFRSTPAVEDINGDGTPEVLVGGGANSGAAVFLWSDFSTLGSQPGPFVPYAAPWPMFKGNKRHAGRYGAGSARFR